MGLARALHRREPETGVKRGVQSWWNLAGIPGFISEAAYGVRGSTEQALQNAASWACIDVLADAIARTPFDALWADGPYRRPVRPAPAVVDSPSGLILQDVWRFQMAWSMLTDGNTFGRIVAYNGQAGRPSQIEILDPPDVTKRKVVDGVAQVVVDNEIHKLYPTGDIWHVPGRMVPAGTPFALSPVAYAGRMIGASLAAEKYSAGFFEDGGHPTAIWTSDQELDGQQAEQIKSALRRVSSGTREPIVVGTGLTREVVQTDPQATQYLDLMRFSVEQACRFWRVPPSMVYLAMAGQNVTYANVTQNDLHYLKHSLDGYLVRVEQAMSSLLPRTQFVKANRNAILRGDITARYAAYQTALTNRFTTVNEVRLLEDLQPFGPEFDVPGIPVIAPPEPPDAPDPAEPGDTGDMPSDMPMKPAAS